MNQNGIVSIISAHNGEEAIKALLESKERIDIIFMDVQMPEMNGIEATQAILLENLKNKAPRIIAVTANVMQGDRERCLQSGMVDYLAKPLKIHEIQDALERWC